MPRRASWFPRCLRHLAAALALLVAGSVAAEKADRSKPMSVEADKPGIVDLARQVVVFNGNVVIAQGTLQIRAERIEVRELADGFRAAVATGAAGKPASFRQKRDGVDETLEGLADRIEYDARSETLRFLGNASVRRLRAGSVVDEILGTQITWNSAGEQFTVQGGTPTAGNPSGRVRAVLGPRAETPAAAAPPASAPPLKATRALGEPR